MHTRAVLARACVVNISNYATSVVRAGSNPAVQRSRKSLYNIETREHSQAIDLHTRVHLTKQHCLHVSSRELEVGSGHETT